MKEMDTLMNIKHLGKLFSIAILATLSVGCCCGRKLILVEEGLPLVFSDNFDAGMDDWKTTDGKKPFWKIEETDRGPALRVTGKSDYEPPVRSPHSIALVRDVVVGDFVMTAKIQNTNVKAGAHRDLCFFWGYQDPSHFYYVHLGAKADPHACQIFIVDGEPRIAITKKEATGTPWTEGWHDVKVVRRVADGTMEVYFDNMEIPHMTAENSKFNWGQVGVGTFDDHGNFDDFKLFADVVPPGK